MSSIETENQLSYCGSTIPKLDYKCIILSTAATNLSTKKESQSCLKLHSVKGVIDLEIVDLSLIIMS